MISSLEKYKSKYQDIISFLEQEENKTPKEEELLKRLSGTMILLRLVTQGASERVHTFTGHDFGDSKIHVTQ